MKEAGPSNSGSNGIITHWETLLIYAKKWLSILFASGVAAVRNRVVNSKVNWKKLTA